jgi:hypothetical protein
MYRFGGVLHVRWRRDGTGSACLLTQTITLREIRSAIYNDFVQGRSIRLTLDREKETKDSLNGSELQRPQKFELAEMKPRR